MNSVPELPVVVVALWEAKATDGGGNRGDEVNGGDYDYR